MNYVYINEELRACEIIPVYTEDFPGIPIIDRYAPDFLDGCVAVSDDTYVDLDMLYVKCENKFVTPVAITSSREVTVPQGKCIAVKLAFSVDCDWSIVDGNGVATKADNNTLSITSEAAGLYHIKIELKTPYQTVTEVVVVAVMGKEPEVIK